MGGDTATITIPGEDPVAVELVLAIREGDVDTVRRLLPEEPLLAGARLTARDGGTESSVAVDACAAGR
jgi:hypothetical protein